MYLKSYKSFYLLISLCFITNSTFAQDTLSIYFDFGSSKLKESEYQKLDKIQENYYFEDIQKVYFIGYCDSVGNIVANIRLSEKRAATVYKYCKSILPENMAFSIEAKGESNLKRTAEASRRVDIVFDYKEETVIINEIVMDELPKIDSNLTIDTKPEVIPKVICHYINYPFLHSSRQQIITANGKEYVVIETEHKYIKKQKYYYQHYNKRSKKWEVKKVRWRTQTTGQLWWRRQRINTKIEVTDYNRSKIFTRVAMDSCQNCNANKLDLHKETKCMQVDSFLMVNAQYKVKLRKGMVKMRVPREYVDTEADYYIGCEKKSKINWEKKWFGKRKKYYFTTLEINPKTLAHASITREMDCCAEEIVPCKAFNAFPPDQGDLKCVTVPLRGRFDLDIGTFYILESHRPYIGLSYVAEFGFKPSSVLKIRAAMTSDRLLFNKVEYNHYLYTFNLLSLNNSTSWNSYNRFTPKYKSRLFTGMSGNSLHDFEGTNQFFGEAHLGINFEKIYPRYLSSAYFLGGASYNFSIPDYQFGPYFELGFSINLYN